MKTVFLKITLISALLIACSSKPKDSSNQARSETPVPKTQASMEAKQLAAEQNSQYVTEISFKKGSTELTAESRRKLEKLLNSVSDERQIEEIKVVSWADQGYPSKEIKTLPKDQLRIAEERNQEIKSFLKTKNKMIPIEVHNMGKRPSRLAQLWGGSDVRIKKSLETNGLTQNGIQAKASHSIVFVELK